MNTTTNIELTPVAAGRKLVPFGGLNIGDPFFATYAGKEYQLVKASRVDATLTETKGDGESATTVVTRKPFLHHEGVEIELN